MNADWKFRAACARVDAMTSAQATGLSFGKIGVTASNEHPEAAQALLCTGSCSECKVAKAVVAQLGAVSPQPSSGADPWMRQLWTQGVAHIDASWGFRTLLHKNGLASLLRSELDSTGDKNLVHILGQKALLGKHSSAAFEEFSTAVLSRLRPVASSYLGGPAAFGGCKLLRMPGRNITAGEYVSGLWHHDRCGRRLKCFVFLGPVTPGSHPTLVVPRTHRTVYYSYQFEPSRFDDAHVARSHAPPLSLQGKVGDGFCFDTNAVHRGTLDGSEARHVAIFEFHDDKLESAFRLHGVAAPFGH